MKDLDKDDLTNFDFTNSRLDDFCSSKLNGDKKRKSLFDFIKTVFLLSHGQENVERVFSVNSDALKTNISTKVFIARRTLYAGSRASNCGLHEIPISKRMLQNCRAARSRYNLYLEQEKQRRQAAEILTSRDRKRKALINNIDTKTKRMKMIEKSKKELGNEADVLAYDAEKKNKLCLLTQSNALRKRIDELNRETSSLHGK